MADLTANDDTANTPAATPVVVPVLANDTLDGNPVAIGDLAGPPTVVTPPSNGTAVVNPDGTVTYTPEPGFCGTDTFEYEIGTVEPFMFTAGAGELIVFTGTFGAEIDWGDGSPHQVAGPGGVTHTYSSAGPHHGRIWFAPGVDDRRVHGEALISVEAWGSTLLGIRIWFQGATNLVAVPATAPPGATSMTFMFNGATSFNQDLSGWCVEHIASEPTGFATNTPAWTLPKPNWGAPC